MKVKFRFKFIITLLLMVLMSGILVSHVSFADEAFDESAMNPKNLFDDKGYTWLTDLQFGSRSLGDIIISALKLTLNIARIIAVGWAIIMGISISMKYMSGSAQIKSQIKTDLPTYLIGAAILFGAAGIITLIQFFIDDNL